jgi:hypothetical protein
LTSGKLTKNIVVLQSIGFLGPAFALLGLNAVKNPTVAAAWLTAAVGLSAFSQAGFLVNHQVALDEFSRCKSISSLIMIEPTSRWKRCRIVNLLQQIFRDGSSCNTKFVLTCFESVTELEGWGDCEHCRKLGLNMQVYCMVRNHVDPAS